MTFLSALAIIVAAGLAGALYFAREQMRRQAVIGARLVADVEAARAVAHQVELELVGCRAACDQARAEAGEARRGHPDVAAALWPVVAGSVEREWRLLMAASASAEAPAPAPAPFGPAALLDRCIGQELDRLREEVGVTAELVGSAPAGVAPEVAIVVHAVTREVAAHAARASDHLLVIWNGHDLQLQTDCPQEIPPELAGRLERAAATAAVALELGPDCAGRPHVAAVLHLPAEVAGT